MGTPLKWTLIAALLAAASGCGTSQPPRLYLLSSPGAPLQTSASSATIGLGPITIPAYLDRSKIMVRTGSNSFKAAEHHRWAEPLESNFARLLDEELGRAMPNATLIDYPWRNSRAVDIQIQLEVLAFESDNSGQARLAVRWELLDGSKKALTPPQRRDYTRGARNSDYESRVAAMSECIAALAQELALEAGRLSSR